MFEYARTREPDGDIAGTIAGGGENTLLGFAAGGGETELRFAADLTHVSPSLQALNEGPSKSHAVDFEAKKH